MDSLITLLQLVSIYILIDTAVVEDESSPC